MKQISYLLVALNLIFSVNLWSQERKVIKVACLGNSITYGSGIEDNIKDAWPPQLGRMLGEGYVVRNFGYPGRTLLQKGNHPYMQTQLFYNAIGWNPDIVIIMLGTNDSKSQNWKFKDDFTADYNRLILSFDTLSSNPVIYPVAVVPVFKGGMRIDSLVVRNEVNPLIKKIAKEHNLHLIDLYTPMLVMGDHFPDAIHPDAVASGEMAKIIYKHLSDDSIGYYTELPKPKLNSEAYHKMRGGIKNSLIKFEKFKKGRVAFLGGSITYNPGWRDSICEYLQKRFPETKFDFTAAGIPSMGSTCDAFRLERDILTNGPVDLLFVEAAVNDGGKGRTNEEQIRSMEGIVRHIRSAAPSTDIVFMYFVDPGKMETYRKGEIPQVIRNHDKVAEYYNIPAIDLAKEVTDRIDAGEFTWKDDFKNLHPSPFGQGVYARSMISFLNDAWSGFVADDDKVTEYSLPPALDPDCFDNGVLIPAVSVKTVKGWTKVDNWTPEDSAWTRHDYVKVPMLIGKYPGKALKFRFKGNAVGIAVAAGPDAGIVEFKIDNGEWKKQDLFTKHSTRYHLPWYYTLAYGLPEGEHILQLRLTNEKNPKSLGNICRIRYFFTNKTNKHTITY